MKRQLNSLSECPSRNDFALLRGRVEACEKADSLMKKSLSEIEKKLKNMKNSGGSGTVDNSVIEEF